MSTILLRTLSEKSIMQIGKYKGLSVSRLLVVDKKYLVYLYYHCELITFKDEVLNQLGIPPEDYIKKPGKSQDLLDKHYPHKYKEPTEHTKKIQKAEYMAFLFADKGRYSRQKLCNNHRKGYF